MLGRFTLPVLLSLLNLISLLILKSISQALVPSQLIFFLLGLAVFFIVSNFKFDLFLKWSPFLYLGVILLLILTEIIGSVTRGSTRWIELGPIHIQASQLVIPFMGLYLSQLVARFSLKKTKNLIFTLIILAIPTGLIFIEPDLGTTLVAVISLSTLLYFNLPNRRDLVILITAAILVVSIGWQFVLKDYQKERLFSFAGGHADTQDAGYNARQAMIAVGSGQVWGRGLGQGVQSHLRFLPERQTDFVFASLAEELGLVGSLIIILIYSLIVISLLLLANRVNHPAGQLFCYVVLMMIVSQSAINIGMNIGLLPITGVTLPFISYGGSSVLTLWGTFGLVQSLIKEQTTKPFTYIT
jgi:rod shape determining protein RodA